jgi:hypothetical protein
MMKSERELFGCRFQINEESIQMVGAMACWTLGGSLRYAGGSMKYFAMTCLVSQETKWFCFQDRVPRKKGQRDKPSQKI